MTETRTATALPPLVEAIEGDLTSAAAAIEEVAAFLADPRGYVGWCGDLPAALNGVRTALESHARTLRSEAVEVRQRMTGEAPAPLITELEARLKVERGVA